MGIRNRKHSWRSVQLKFGEKAVADHGIQPARPLRQGAAHQEETTKLRVMMSSEHGDRSCYTTPALPRQTASPEFVTIQRNTIPLTALRSSLMVHCKSSRNMPRYPHGDETPNENHDDCGGD